MKVPDIIDLLERIYSRHAKLGMRGCYQFSFIDQPEGAAEFQVNVGDTATVQPGRATHADLTIEMRYEHLEGSVVGQVDLPQKLLHAEISARGRLTMLYQLGALVESLRSGEAPNPALAEKKSYKLRYPSVPRPCEARSAARAPILEIERRRDVSLDEFHSRYVAQGIPIIMEGAASHWPLAQMNLEAARSFLGNLHGYALEAGYEDQVFEGSVNGRFRRRIRHARRDHRGPRDALHGQQPDSDRVPPADRDATALRRRRVHPYHLMDGSGGHPDPNPSRRDLEPVLSGLGE